MDLHPAVAQCLPGALAEFRWRDHTLRVSCGAFVGAAFVVLGSSEPPFLPSLAGMRLVGEQAAAVAELCRADGIMVPDVTADERLRGQFWRGNGASFVLPLRVNGVLIGLVRLDGESIEDLDTSARERLRDLAPVSLLAAAIERDRAALAPAGVFDARTDAR